MLVLQLQLRTITFLKQETLPHSLLHTVWETEFCLSSCLLSCCVMSHFSGDCNFYPSPAPSFIQSYDPVFSYPINDALTAQPIFSKKSNFTPFTYRRLVYDILESTLKYQTVDSTLKWHHLTTQAVITLY